MKKSIYYLIMSILVTFQFIVLYFIILQFYPFKIVELKEFKITVYKNIGLSSSKRKLFIPKNLPPDTYTIHVDISYKITPFRQVNYVWQSNSFEVIK